MIKRLLHDVVKDDADLAQKLESSNLLPLVRELNHKYGMVVYEESKRGSQWTTDDNFLLTDGQGMPLGRVFMADGSYCYYAPYVAKERGADDFDRHTFRSKKLSTLMTTLKRMNIVASSDEVINKINENYTPSLVYKVYGSFPSVSKQSLNSAHAHRLLLAMKEGKSLNDFTQEDRDLYLSLLDKYNEADILDSRRKQGTEEVFKDTYLVFGDTLGQYIVAEATYEYKGNDFIIKHTTPFKRVKDLTEYPRILTALTMLKVHKGEEFRPFDNQNSLVPLGDAYIPDLEMVYGYRSRNTPFDMGCVCLAK